MIQQLQNLLADDPEFPCCSCEHLHQRKNVTAFKFSESKKCTSNMWQTLKAYMYMSNADATEQTLYVCQYCRPILNNDCMPSRCVLNGLEVEVIPAELENFGPLSKQLIQRGKAAIEQSLLDIRCVTVFTQAKTMPESRMSIGRQIELVLIHIESGNVFAL